MKYLKGRWNLLIASVIIFLIAVLQWNRWGVNILQELNDGCFFFLGGPSLFYPTALFPSLVAVGYIITFFVSLGKVEISEQGNRIHITEKKGWYTQKASFSFTSITSTSFGNIKLRWSGLGTVILILSSYYLFIDGISLLTYDAVYGFGIDTGIYYIVQASGNLIAVVFVIFFTPGEIRIRSTEIDRIIVSIPIMWSRNQKNRFESNLSELLRTSTKGKSAHNHRVLLSIVYGLILVSSSIISRIFLIFSNEILRIIYLFIGIYYLTEGIKQISINSKYGLWMIQTSQNPRILLGTVISYTSWILIIAITLFTVINNTISIPPETNIKLIALVNSIFLVIMLFPGIWNGIHYIAGKRIKKREKIVV